MNESIDITDPDAILKQQVRTILTGVYDPEVGLDIINMGLVYDVNYEKDENAILITMTLTSKGCPMGPMITQDVGESLQQQFPEKDINIHLVWEPKWSADNITEEGRKALGWE